MIPIRPFSGVYRSLLMWIMNSPVEHQERTGKAVHVGRGGTAFSIDLSDGILPTCGLRKTFPRTAAAENAWYLKGDRDLAWLRQYAPIWDKFAEEIYSADDLEEVRPYEGIKAAYGYRWRQHFGRDQIALAIATLKADPSDRRCFVSAWDPSFDGLGAVGQRNVPCPAAFTLGVTAGELHSTLTLRSSDVFVGLPYDVMGHALLMDAIAASLGVKPGIMTFVLANAHIYENHWAMAEIAMRETAVSPPIGMPRWTVDAITAESDLYVKVLSGLSQASNWPDYSPRPEVVL